MKQVLIGLTLIISATVLATGCCKSTSSSDTEASPAEPTGDKSGAAAGTSLTGEDAVKKLKAAGFQPLMEPVVSNAGPAKTTTFIAKPDGISVSIIEYKDETVAKMAQSGMTGEQVISSLHGSTVVMVTCPPTKPRAKCEELHAAATK